MAAKKKNKKTDNIKEIADKLLKLMGTTASVDVSEDKENEAMLVDIKTDNEAGLIIGNRGRTLNSIQSILGMIYKQKHGEWQRILVNVADWREKEKDRLEQLALQAAERAVSTGEEQSLYNLSSSQRRIVHMILVDEKKVETESLGEGSDRRLVIRPQK